MRISRSAEKTTDTRGVYGIYKYPFTKVLCYYTSELDRINIVIVAVVQTVISFPVQFFNECAKCLRVTFENLMTNF